MSGVDYQFEVWQDEIPVASGSASTPEEAQREAGHYALMYGQGGPVELRFYERREIQP